MKYGLHIKMIMRNLAEILGLKEKTKTYCKKKVNSEGGKIEIYEGLFSYTGLTGCFINDMVSRMVCAELQGYTAIPRVKAKNEQFDIWGSYFKVPKCADKCETDNMPFRQIFYWENVFLPKIFTRYCDLYQKYCVLNKSTEVYINDEYQKLGMSTKKILGVLVRGTDYTNLSPKGHPIQPDVNKIIEKVEKCIRTKKFDAIYLATEESKVYFEFCKNFGEEKILINKRMWFDDVYIKKEKKFIDEIHFFRENDDYLKGLEYLSSIILLSKCDALVAGMNGGTFCALCFNNQQYEYKYIFDLGFYT